MKKTEQIQGWFNYQLTYDRLINSIPNNGIFVECGAWLGKSSSYLCDTIQANRPDIEVIIIDSWKGSVNEVQTTHKLATEKDIYEIFLSNMGTRKYKSIRSLSVDASKLFEDESLDVIFIDMCHLYECVLDDIKAWYPKLKYNGYMAGHDHSWGGVNKAVKESFVTCEHADGDCWLIQKTSDIYKLNKE